MTGSFLAWKKCRTMTAMGEKEKAPAEVASPRAVKIEPFSRPEGVLDGGASAAALRKLRAKTGTRQVAV
jgi:hypothetical protein